MGIFKNIRTRKDIDLLIEEKFYEYVADEIANGEIRHGLWAKATATADSASEGDIRRKYIELRVELLRAEGRLYRQFLNEALGNRSNQSSGSVSVNKSGKIAYKWDKQDAERAARARGNRATSSMDKYSWFGIIITVIVLYFIFYMSK